MVVPDLPAAEKGADAKPAQKRPTPRNGVKISLKESELASYLKQRGIDVDQEDPLILFAQLVIKNTKTANKSVTLAKARELVKDIHY